MWPFFLNRRTDEYRIENIEMNTTKYNIEERLIDFSVAIISLMESLPNTRVANYLGNQLLRSGISPSLNYGEACSAESRNDFIHKMKICLKELRESYNNLRICSKANFCKAEDASKRK